LAEDGEGKKGGGIGKERVVMERGGRGGEGEGGEGGRGKRERGREEEEAGGIGGGGKTRVNKRGGGGASAGKGYEELPTSRNANLNLYFRWELCCGKKVISVIAK